MRFLARLAAGQVLGLVLLYGLGVRWPSTAAQVATGLQSFAMVVAALAAAAVAALAVLIVRSQRQAPYLQGRDSHA